MKKVACWKVGCWEYATEGRSWNFGQVFKFRGQHYDEILITLIGVRCGENFVVNIGEGCMRSIHFKVRLRLTL